MDTNSLRPFFEAAGSVFSQMFGLEPEASAPRALDGAESHDWEVSGLLGIAGSSQGVLALRFTMALVDRLLEASGVETRDEQDRLATASGLVAEMTNIVAGNAIGGIAGQNLEISPPVVIKGKNHQITWPKIAPVVAVDFNTSLGAFELAVCYNGK